MDSCASMAFLRSIICSCRDLVIGQVDYKLKLLSQRHRLVILLIPLLYHSKPVLISNPNITKKGVVMISMKGKVAVVTGASRGVGKGIALGLGEAGATVYITGRTVKNKTDAGKLGGTVFQTAEDVTAIGGKGVAIHCDHRDDAQVEKAFKQIAKESKKIDLLGNNAWGGYENMLEGRKFTYLKPFWEQPFWRWDAMFDAGVRAAYIASAFAARIMTKKKNGLIVNISFWSAQVYLGNTQYGVSKAAVDKMSEYMAHELEKFNVAVVAVYPRFVGNESGVGNAKHFPIENSAAPPVFCVAVAALGNTTNIQNKNR